METGPSQLSSSNDDSGPFFFELATKHAAVRGSRQEGPWARGTRVPAAPPLAPSLPCGHATLRLAHAAEHLYGPRVDENMNLARWVHEAVVLLEQMTSRPAKTST